MAGFTQGASFLPEEDFAFSPIETARPAVRPDSVAPTRDDIEYLRAHPEVAEKFETRFKVPAAQFMRVERAKPTENDIDYLRKNPSLRQKFEKQFGPADPYLKGKSERPKTRLQQLNEATKDWHPLSKIGLAPQRLSAMAADVGDAIFDPANIMASAEAVGDVVGRIPEIVSDPENLKEVARGAVQGAATLPGALAGDLPLAAVDLGMQIMTGADPLDAEAYETNPLGSGTTRGMLEDWGNKGLAAAGAPEIFNFDQPATEAGKTARRIGEFAGAGGIAGGARAVIPSIGGAIGAEAAREVAPDQPGWQAFGGIAGAVTPGAVARAPAAALGGIRRVAESAKPAARMLTEGGREQIVGNILREASGTDTPPPIAPAPIAGIQNTLGQATDNPGLLQLEKTIAMGSPENTGMFKQRLQESHGAARRAVEDLRGGGSPEAIRQTADDAAQMAQRLVDDATARSSTGMTPGTASDVARGRLEGARESFRGRRREAWRQVENFGDDAMMDVDPLRTAIAGDLQRLGRFFDQKAVPGDVEQALRTLGERNTLSSLQDLRSEMGDLARTADAGGNAKMARVYNTIRTTIGNYLDNYEFPNPDVQAAYQTARNLSRLEAELYKRPSDMRQTLGTDRFGGDTTTSGETLSKFVRPGPGGRDRLRHVLTVDGSQEMQNAIGDYMSSLLAERTSLAAQQKFMRQYAESLDEIPVIRDRLQQVVAARESLERLRQSPLSMFHGVEPQAGMQRLMVHPDRIRTVRRLRADLSRSSSQAWDGFRALYVEEVLRRIESSIEKDGAGGFTIKPGVMNKFYKDNADITREILGPVGEQTLANVADAVEMLTRTQRGGYPGGSPTYSLLSGDRFIDHILEKYIEHEGAPLAAAGAGAAAGAATAGPVGAIFGAGGGLVAQHAFANAKVQVQHLLRDAMLDPAKGRALMLKATPQSLNALPRPMRPFMRPFLRRLPGAAGGVANPPDQNREAKPPPLKVGQIVKGRRDGRDVSYRYRGGDPMKPQSWEPAEAR